MPFLLRSSARRSTAETILLAISVLLPFPSLGLNLDPSKFYRLESRDDGWVAERTGDGSLVLGACKHEGKMRFQFTPDGDFYAVSTDSNPLDVLTVADASLASRVAVTMEPDSGADRQRWQIEDRGDGYVAILNKASGLAFGHTIDTTPTNPIVNDGTGAQFLYGEQYSPNLDWLVAESHPLPYDSIGVNQNGYAPSQKKTAVFTRAIPTGTIPSFAVTGPQPLSGTMELWGQKWGHEFYTADLTDLSTVGRYEIEVTASEGSEGITSEFNVFEGPFRNVRGSRGGELTWGNVVHGFLATQTAPSPTGLDDAIPLAKGDEIVNWTPIVGAAPHVMTDGWYDATSRDSKTARSATTAKFLALASLEAADNVIGHSSSAEKAADLLPALRMAVEHLTGDQYPDGSFPLGKFRTNVPSNPGYHWSVDTDAGITARHVTALAVLAQALETSDPVLSAIARESAAKGWGYIAANPTDFKIDDAAYAGLLQDYYGGQASVINAAIELFLLTRDSIYSSFADSRIVEGTYRRGKYEKEHGWKDGSTAWPGTATVSKMDDMVDASTVLHLCRYHRSIADGNNAVESMLVSHIFEWSDYWRGLIDTPWGVPENGGAAGVRSGWSRNLASLAPQFLAVGRFANNADAIDAGTAILDYLLGNNAVASSFYMGAGRNNYHPRFKYSSEKTAGAIIPGLKTEGGVLSLTGQASKTGESVTMHTTPMLLALAHADALYPAASSSSDGGHHRAPMFYAGTIETGDAFHRASYAGRSLASTILDPDGAAGVRFLKASGPAWLTVSADGTLGGTPPSVLGTSNDFVVQATNAAGLSDTAHLIIDVKTEIRATSAPVRFEVAEDTYAKESAKSINFGMAVGLEVRRAVESAPFARVAYLKFFVSGLDLDLNAAATTIEGATLNLYAAKPTDEIYALSVSDTAWEETGLTWNYRPDITTETYVGGGRVTDAAGGWMSIDVSGFVARDGTYAFALVGEISSGKDVLGSREGGRGAYLDVIVSAAAEAQA